MLRFFRKRREEDRKRDKTEQYAYVKVLFKDVDDIEVEKTVRLSKPYEIRNIESIIKSKDIIKTMIRHGYTYLGWFPINFKTDGKRVIKIYS